MKYSFDKIIDRSGTDAVKIDAMQKIWHRTDLIPLWVADMDFETPFFIRDALKERMEHPVYGYTLVPQDYWHTVMQWISSHHDWQVKREWLTFIPGIVRGIGMVVNVFTQPGDKIIIQPPVYHPFRNVPEDNGRKVVDNPLVKRADGYYDMDFDNLAKVADEKCKILILSNPHNPAGICWDRQTLERLAHFCKEHNILVVSDEIHCDMALFGNKHIPFATVSEEAAQNSITFAAPSKTFNMAGIVSSWAVVPNDSIRHRFYTWLKANEMDHPTLFAPIATMAAFRHGEHWRQQMISYIEGNIEFVESFCKTHIPQIRPLRPQASFLIWLDCNELNLDHDSLNALFAEKARLALNDGEMFGHGGEGYMRMNIGCPRSIIENAMDRLLEAIKNI